MKANTASQASKTATAPAVKPARAEVPQEKAEVEDYMDEDEANPVKEHKLPVLPQKQPQEAVPEAEQEKIGQILREIEMLHNNGRYRVEKLNLLNEIKEELNEINKALVVIAGVLVDGKAKPFFKD
jgi:hypothetical protein